MTGSSVTAHARTAVLVTALLMPALWSSCVAASPKLGAPPQAVPDSIGYAVVTANEATFAFPVLEVMEGRWPAASGVAPSQGYSWEVWTAGYPLPVVISHLIPRMPPGPLVVLRVQRGRRCECRATSRRAPAAGLHAGVPPT